LIVLGLTFSRSAIFVFVITAGTLYLLKNRKINYFILGLFLIFVTAIGYLFIINSLDTVSERIYLLNKAWSVIIRSPVLGIGYGNFPLAKYSVGFNNPFIFYQPVHNIYALLLTETGIPLFLIILYFVYFYIRKYLLKSNVFLQAAVFDVLFLGLIDHYWLTSVQNLLLLSVLLALIVVISKTHVNTKLS
jgi:O-antigen ligase